MTEATAIEAAERVFIGELAMAVHRKVGTVRRWVTAGMLPVHLRPARADSVSSWRYWTPEQVEGIKQWIRDERVFPGTGLPNFKPNDEQIEALVENRPVPKAAA